MPRYANDVKFRTKELSLNANRRLARLNVATSALSSDNKQIIECKVINYINKAAPTVYTLIPEFYSGV